MSFSARSPFRARGPFKARGPFRTAATGPFGVDSDAAPSFFSGGTQFDFRLTPLAALLAAGLTNAVATTNPPGTVVSSDGKVQYGAHNLLTWLANASSAFGGKTVATTLAAGSITFTNVSTGYAYGVTASLPAGTYTMRVTFSGPAGRAVGVRVCDSATGTQQASQAVTCTGASQTITLTVTTTSAGTIDAGFDARSGVVPGTTLVNGDVIQFAQYQLNLGPTALDYVPTTTAAVYAPRLTCERGATSNLAAWSEDLTNGVYIGSASVAGTVPSVATGRSLQKVYENGTTAQRWMIGQSITVGTSATIRVDVAAAERKRVALREGSQTGAMVLFDASTGTIVATASCTAWAKPLGSGQYTVYMTPTGLTAGAKTFTVETMLDTDTVWASGGHAGVTGSGIYVGNLAVANVAGEFAYLRTYATAPLYSAGTPTSQNLVTQASSYTPGTGGWVAVAGGSATAQALTLPSVNSRVEANVQLVPGCVYTLKFTISGTGQAGVRLIENGGSFSLLGGSGSIVLTGTPTDYTYRLVATSTAAGMAALQLITDIGSATATVTNLRVYEGTGDLPYVATSGSAVSVYPQRAMKREPARTNAVLWNRALTNAAWSKVNGAAVTGNAVDSLMGATDACLLTGVASTVAYVKQNFAVAAGTTRTVSSLVRAGTAAYSRLAMYDQTDTTRICGVELNWSNGVPSIGTLSGTWSTTPVLEPWGLGWWRVKGSYSTGALTTVALLWYPDASNGAGTTAVDFVKDELGGWATMPIITGASAVTRDADLIRPGSIITDGPMTVLVQARADKVVSGSPQALIGRTGAGRAVYVSDTGLIASNDGTNTASSGVIPPDGVSFRAVVSWSGATLGISAGGAADVSGAYDGTMGSGSVCGFGDDGTGGNGASVDLEIISIVGTAANATQRQALMLGTML